MDEVTSAGLDLMSSDSSAMLELQYIATKCRDGAETAIAEDCSFFA